MLEILDRLEASLARGCRALCSGRRAGINNTRRLLPQAPADVETEQRQGRRSAGNLAQRPAQRLAIASLGGKPGTRRRLGESAVSIETGLMVDLQAGGVSRPALKVTRDYRRHQADQGPDHDADDARQRHLDLPVLGATLPQPLDMLEPPVDYWEVAGFGVQVGGDTELAAERDVVDAEAFGENFFSAPVPTS